MNNRIRAREVRVVDESGKQLGVMRLEEALRSSRERNLDLIQVTEKVEPPVCKIMNYGKYLYQEKRKEKKAPKIHGGLKEIRLGFRISQHDSGIRANLAEKFLKKGYKVKVEMNLRGRERALSGFAREKINKFLEVLEGIIPIKVERELKREARGFTIIISKAPQK